jgi:hypothetical protein
MISLIYISTPTPHFLNEKEIELKKIAESCQKNNEELAITGKLIFCESNFLQYIEGEEQNVERVYNLISKDLRHKRLTIISRQTIEKRIFPKWKMKTTLLEPVDKESLKLVYQWKAIVKTTESSMDIPRDQILDFLKLQKFE